MLNIIETKRKGHSNYTFTNRGVDYSIYTEDHNEFTVFTRRKSLGSFGGSCRIVYRSEIQKGPKVMREFLDAVDAKPTLARSSLDQLI